MSDNAIVVNPVANAMGIALSSMNMWNIVNQFGKHDFSCRLFFAVGR